MAWLLLGGTLILASAVGAVLLITAKLRRGRSEGYVGPWVLLSLASLVAGIGLWCLTGVVSFKGTAWVENDPFTLPEAVLRVEADDTVVTAGGERIRIADVEGYLGAKMVSFLIGVPIGDVAEHIAESGHRVQVERLRTEEDGMTLARVFVRVDLSKIPTDFSMIRIPFIMKRQPRYTLGPLHRYVGPRK